MSFKYYITNLFNGKVVGTNNEELAKQNSYCEEYFVIDIEAGAWLLNGSSQVIEELEND